MKKLLLVAAVALIGTFANAQEGHFKVGVHAGLPIGDAGDGYSFNAGVDAAYVFAIADNIDLGVTTGYSHYFGKSTSETIGGGSIGGITIPQTTFTFDNPDFGIVPLAATAQYNIDGGFNIGADLGYAFFVGENAEGGGFYYQPKVGYTFGEMSSIYVGYKGVSDNGSTLSSINLGYAYKF